MGKGGNLHFASRKRGVDYYFIVLSRSRWLGNWYMQNSSLTITRTIKGRKIGVGSGKELWILSWMEELNSEDKSY